MSGVLGPCPAGPRGFLGLDLGAWGGRFRVDGREGFRLAAAARTRRIWRVGLSRRRRVTTTEDGERVEAPGRWVLGPGGAAALGVDPSLPVEVMRFVR